MEVALILTCLAGLGLAIRMAHAQERRHQLACVKCMHDLRGLSQEAGRGRE